MIFKKEWRTLSVRLQGQRKVLAFHTHEHEMEHTKQTDRGIKIKEIMKEKMFNVKRETGKSRLSFYIIYHSLVSIQKYGSKMQ